MLFHFAFYLSPGERVGVGVECVCVCVCVCGGGHGENPDIFEQHRPTPISFLFQNFEFQYFFFFGGGGGWRGGGVQKNGFFWGGWKFLWIIFRGHL